MITAESRYNELLSDQSQQELQELEQKRARTQADQTKSLLQRKLHEVSNQLFDAEANQQRLQKLLRSGEVENCELTLQLEDLKRQCEKQVGHHQQQISEALQQLDELRSALAAEQETKVTLVAQLNEAAPHLNVVPSPEGSLSLQQEKIEASLQRLASAEHREEVLQAERETKLLALAKGKAKELELSQELDKVLSVNQQLEAQLASALQENNSMTEDAKKSLAIIASMATQWKDAQQVLQKEQQGKLVLQRRLDDLQHEFDIALQSQSEERSQMASQLQEAITRVTDAEANKEKLARREAQSRRDLDETQ